MLSRMSLRLHHRALTKTYSVSCITFPHRSLHLSCRFRDTTLKNSRRFELTRHQPLIAAAFVRHASTSEEKVVEELLPSIPDAPVLPTPEITDIVQIIGEPPLSSLGLAGWTPVGWVQSALEWLHIGCDLPWWGTIVIGTIVVRTVMFPLVIKAQRNSARMNNYMPQIQHLQQKLTEARQTGQDYDAARYGQELMIFMKDKGVSPMKNMLVPLAQAPLFISFFMGLRGMTNAPVASLREGGLWWFTDLTLADQYYLLPIITSATMYITIALGVDGAKVSAMNLGMFRYVMKGIPIVVFPFIMNFPAAILCYWVSTNFISLIQAGVLKIPSVRTYFKIEPMIEHDLSKLPVSKGFVKGFKESWSNMKVARELSDRGQADHLEFRRAGTGPVPKTYKYNPTTQAQPHTQILARKRD